MPEMWVEVSGRGEKRRWTLKGGLTRVGAEGCDVAIGDCSGDELHVWTDPPKLIHVGEATTPLCNGRAFQELGLNDGDSVQWGERVLVFGIEDDVLVEVGAPEPSAKSAPAAPAAPSPTGTSGADPGSKSDRAWRRVAAGMLVELKIADKKAAKTWQQSVMRGEFDADACSREVLAASGVALDDSRLLERAGRLERDLLMMPLQTGVRSAGRRARRAARGGLAYVIAQFVAIGVYTLILIAILLLVRVKYDYSLDGLFDSWLDAVSSSDS